MDPLMINILKKLLEKFLEHQLSSTSTEETKELHIKVLQKAIQLKAKDKEERAKKAIQRKAKEKEERVIREFTEFFDAQAEIPSKNNARYD